jgi:hypothetical protein
MRTLLRPIAILIGVLSMTSQVEAKRVVTDLRLEDGKTIENTIPEPVLDGSKIKPLTILPFRQAFPSERGWERSEPRVASGLEGLLIGSAPKVAPTLDFGALFSQALGQQAKALGLTLGDGGWTIGGTLEDLWVDTWSNGWNVVYYTGLVVNLDITAPDGARSSQTLRLFGVHMRFSKTPGASVARLLLEGSQETLARLNTTLLKAPPLPAAGRMMAEIDAKGIADREFMANAVGLSGDPAAIAVFLKVLERSKDEDERGVAIEALARIGDPAVIAPLIARNPTEGKDARWFILKAMGYIGSPEANKFVKNAVLLDDDVKCRTLAEAIRGAGFAR